MKLLVLDNFDSFTHNIVHYAEQLVDEVSVIDHYTIQTSQLSEYDAVILSPGPGLPKEAGKLMEVLKQAQNLQLPLLGVCLGMQAIAIEYGGELYNQEHVKHGVSETIQVVDPNSILFQLIPQEFKVGLYHSWAVHVPELSQLKVTAVSESGVVMAVEDPMRKTFGIQFHPESVLSEHGLKVFSNFFDFTKRL